MDIKSPYTVLMFIVYNENGTMIAWNSFNLRYIKYGYRIVPLLDGFLNRIPFANLFININIT